MFTVTAITTPAVLIALLKESIYRPPHYSPQELEMIARLETLDQFQKQCEEEIQQEENYYFSQLFVYLKPHYDRWFAKDTHGNSCASRPHPELSYINPDQPFTTATTLTHYVPDLLCYFWKYYKKLTADCVAIAQDGCIASREHPEITDHFPEINAKFNLVLGERALLQREIASIKEPHESWTSIINFPLTGLVTGVGLLALVGLAFTAKKYHDIRVGHHTNMTRAQQLDQCMPDLTHSDVVQLTTRLGIIVNDTTTIKDLISQLTAKSADIDYRRKQRIAFLGGALRNDTDLYHFFRNGGNRDVKKMILDAADLGTSPRPA